MEFPESRVTMVMYGYWLRRWSTKINYMSQGPVQRHKSQTEHKNQSRIMKQVPGQMSNSMPLFHFFDLGDLPLRALLFACLPCPVDDECQYPTSDYEDNAENKNDSRLPRRPVLIRISFGNSIVVDGLVSPLGGVNGRHW